jgi:hypothetical protein
MKALILAALMATAAVAQTLKPICPAKRSEMSDREKAIQEVRNTYPRQLEGSSDAFVEKLLPALVNMAERAIRAERERDEAQRSKHGTPCRCESWIETCREAEERAETAERALAQIRESKGERPDKLSTDTLLYYDVELTDQLLDSYAQREAAYKAAWERAEYDKTQIIKIGEEELAKKDARIAELLTRVSPCLYPSGF